MATIQTDIESQIVKLASESFNAFCEDISGMFGVDVGCKHQGIVTDETVKELKKRFKKLAAVSSIKSEGAIDGTFQLVFDKGGLFTLAGVVVALPEQEILQHIKHGLKKDAEEISDAVGEVGNILTGSWDRVFRKELDGHGQLAQIKTFVGNPWDNPEEKIGLNGNEEFLFVPCEMTVGSYPSFNCGVIFSKTVLGERSESDGEQATAPAKETEHETEEKSEELSEKKVQDEKAAAEETAEVAETTTSDNITGQEPAVETESDKITKPAKRKISEAIRKMTQSRADLPGERSLVSLSLCAKDIMQKEIVWGSSDDSVQQALTRMQEAGADYMMVGKNGVIEGIVSRSDIAGVVSCYLRPIFAKWRRPLDDATLNIKIKWIMSRPVHTIGPDTSLAEIMENMNKLGRRCLPVVDEQGGVQGQVTVFDIFQALLSSDGNVSPASKTSY